MKYLKITSFIFFNIIVIRVFCQDLNKIIIDEKSQMEVLIGICNRNGLTSNFFKTYYDSEYTTYIPDNTIINNIKTIITDKNIQIIIVMGSWCGDSQKQVPRFYKIVDNLSLSESKISLYCVDRTKKSNKGETDNLDIKLVPTFIFYRDGKEIGRIIESPKETLEKDMLQIFS